MSLLPPIIALLLVAQDPIPISVPSRAGPVSYAKEVADIFAAKCLGCHNAGAAKSKLVLEDVAGMLKGGQRGPAIVPGKAEESLLLQLASHRAKPHMPPVDKAGTDPLTPGELGLIKLWIDAGAKDDSADSDASPRPVELGTLPAGIQPIVAVDMTADGHRIAAGRANRVQVYDADSGLEIATLGGHQDIIQSLRFSADGTKLAAGSYRIVTLWNCPTGGLARTFAGHRGAVAAVAAVAGGETFVSVGADKMLRVWEARGQETRKIELPDAGLAVATSPDGRLVAAGCRDGTIRAYTIADGQLAGEWKIQGLAVQGLAFVGNDRLAAAFAGGLVPIFSLPKSLDAPAGPPVFLRGHEGTVHAIAASPDGHWLVTGGEDRTARVWDPSDGRLVKTLENHDGPVLAVAAGPKGDLVLTGSADHQARIFEWESGALLQTLAAHRGPVRGVAFSPDGTRVVTAGDEGGLMVWEAHTGRKVIAFGHVGENGNAKPQPLRGVAFLNNGAFVSASDDHTLRSWTFQGSWSDWKTLGPHAGRVLALDFNPDGTLLAAGAGEPSRSGELTAWETGKGLLVHRLDRLHSDTIFGARFSPDGQRLATASADRFLKVIDVSSGRELRSFEGHNHHVLAVDWNADGTQLVTGGADNVLKFWDFAAGELLRTSPPLDKQVTAVRWSRNGRSPVIAAASGDRSVHFFNPTSGRSVRDFHGPGDYVFGVAITPDHARVAAGGADGVLFLWDGNTGEVLRKFEP